MKLEFSGQIFDNYSSTEFYKEIRPVRDELFHADGQIDIEASWSYGRFSQFWERA
jgi:hypothetical protein